MHHDLIRYIRRNYGPNIVSQITIDSLYDGLNDVKSIVKETSEIDPKHGVMITEIQFRATIIIYRLYNYLFFFYFS